MLISSMGAILSVPVVAEWLPSWGSLVGLGWLASGGGFLALWGLGQIQGSEGPQGLDSVEPRSFDAPSVEWGGAAWA